MLAVPKFRLKREKGEGRQKDQYVRNKNEILATVNSCVGPRASDVLYHLDYHLSHSLPQVSFVQPSPPP